jgi:hypothetical protein
VSVRQMPLSRHARRNFVLITCSPCCHRPPQPAEIATQFDGGTDDRKVVIIGEHRGHERLVDLSSWKGRRRRRDSELPGLDLDCGSLDLRAVMSGLPVIHGDSDGISPLVTGATGQEFSR